MLIVLLVDSSESMNEQTGYDSGVTKAELAAAAVNMFIDELLMHCTGMFETTNCFDLSVCQYGGQSAEMSTRRRNGWESIVEFGGRDVPTVPTWYPLFGTSGTRRTMIDCRQWIRPTAEGKTPMCKALSAAGRVVARWCRSVDNADSLPPIVINITDGELTDGDLEHLGKAADSIKRCTTNSGNALLFNIHLGSTDCGESPVVFPCSRTLMPSGLFAQQLFEISSILPPYYAQYLPEYNGSVDFKPRAVGFNCTPDEVMSLIKVCGTTPITTL